MHKQRVSRGTSEILGAHPPIVNDPGMAAQYVHIIRVTLDRATLSTTERRRLYKLRAKWERRAAGKDVRWTLYGSRPGAPKKAPKPAYDPDDDLKDPLVASIEAKYGKQGHV